ncbi:glutamine synthetase family protein [Streptomyces sp. NPDC002784]
MVVVDQHGVPRAKFLSASAAEAAFVRGLNFSSAMYQMDSGNTVFTGGFVSDADLDLPEMTGFPDVVAVPDPATFRVLPWADRTGWMLCDTYFPSGLPNPLCGRGLLSRQLEALGQDGLRYVAGLEVEFLVVRRDVQRIALDDLGHPPPVPLVSATAHGYQFLSETRLDSAHTVLGPLRDALWEVGLEPRTMEDEWGPGQFEFTFSPLEGLAAADAMVILRSAVKQVCARHGFLASFMSTPHLPHSFPSGWHLHSSLITREGTNVFADAHHTPSQKGLQYIAGQLRHAPALTAFATPTANGYGRYRPYSFAPWRIGWSVDNRGCAIRVVGGPGDTGTHVENRLGEPCANPYLYMAADLAAGRDGMNRSVQPPPAEASDPYAGESQPLPRTLAEAVSALEESDFYRSEFGDRFVSYYVKMRRFEIARRQEAIQAAGAGDEASAGGRAAAQDWEMREYFEFF